MNELIENLSMKYDIPTEKVRGMVSEVVSTIEKDLPMTVAVELETELHATADESLLKRSGWDRIP